MAYEACRPAKCLASAAIREGAARPPAQSRCVVFTRPCFLVLLCPPRAHGPGRHGESGRWRVCMEICVVRPPSRPARVALCPQRPAGQGQARRLPPCPSAWRRLSGSGHGQAVSPRPNGKTTCASRTPQRVIPRFYARRPPFRDRPHLPLLPMKAVYGGGNV